MSTFTTTKLTKKQAHALLRTMAQSLNESEARGETDALALSNAFGAPCATGNPRDVLTRKLLGRLFHSTEPGQRAIARRAWYRHEPAAQRWGAIHTNNKTTREVPTIESAWSGLHTLAQRYGVQLVRQKTGTCTSAAPAGPAEPAQNGVNTVQVVVADPGCKPTPGQGTFTRAKSCKIRRSSHRTDRPEPFPHAPALARALSAHTRSHERRSEDGDTLHSDAACALSLNLREPMLARTIRARSSVPCVQLYVDVSGSMGDRLGIPAMQSACSIMEACRVARVPVQCFQFAGNITLVSDWNERKWPMELHSGHNTDLPYALSEGLPVISKRTERRKIALVLTDGSVGYDENHARHGIQQPLTTWRRYADAHGIELYAIGLGVDVPHGPETFHGAIRIDKPEELCSTAARELARVIGRGERVAV